MQFIERALSPLEVETIINRAKGMREDEKSLTIANMPTQMLNADLERRETYLKRKLECVYMILGNVTEDMSIIDMENVLNELKAIVNK